MGIRRVSLRALIAVLVGMFFVSVPVGVASATEVRSGASWNWRAPWIDAYSRIGGATAIGSPENTVHSWAHGCLQDYGGGQYFDSALMSPGCTTGRVYPVIGQHWQFVAAVGASTIGYPQNDSHRWGAGWTQDFDGGDWGPSLLMRGDAVGQVHAVHTGFRDYYLSQSGPGGWLGYPTSDEYIWANNSRQDFQGGSIVWAPYLGVRPVPIWNERATYHGVSDPTVYVVINGRSYGVTSPEQLTTCYGGWGPVRWISDDATNLSLSAYPYSGAAPACIAPREAHAATWAQAQLGRTDRNGWCELFVEEAFATHGRYISAAAHLAQKRASNQLHAGDTAVPVGAIAFFAPSWQNGYNGHVMISIGNGQFVSTGARVFITGINQTLFGPYAGWTYADSTWPSR
ncbi:MAG: hypothetical protein U0526_02885 [Candidatus Saccharibacteria bacterium]